MIRHLKEEVLKELPPKRKMVIPLDLDDVEAREYWNADAEFMEWISNTKQRKLEIQNHMALLRQLAYQAKRNSLFEWIDSWLDENPEEKIVIFGYHLHVLDDLEKHYNGLSVRIDGSVSSKKRQGIIDQFQEDKKTRVFIGQINAAGVGIDLTIASTVVFSELTWVPGDMEQAEDRIHRVTSIGKDHVDIIYLTAAGTFEDDLAEALIEKYKVVKKVLDNHNDSQFFSGQYLFDKVLEKRRKKKIA
jgi:SWI/SNF-related matrix-associated actin-dependent regulator 1 of chromatin subfamily A